MKLRFIILFYFEIGFSNKNYLHIGCFEEKKSRLKSQTFTKRVSWSPTHRRTSISQLPNTSEIDIIIKVNRERNQLKYSAFDQLLSWLPYLSLFKVQRQLCVLPWVDIKTLLMHAPVGLFHRFVHVRDKKSGSRGKEWGLRLHDTGKNANPLKWVRIHGMKMLQICTIYLHYF